MKHVRCWPSGRVVASVAVLAVLGCSTRSVSIGGSDGSGLGPRGGSNASGGTATAGASSGGSLSGGASSGGTGTQTIVLEDPNNYVATNELSIPIVETAPTGDLTVCWTGVTSDLACRDVTPETDIDMVALLRSRETAAAFTELLSAGELTMAAIDGYIQLPVEQGTCAELSLFSNFGTPVDVTDYYTATNRSYLVMATRGDVPASGSVSMVLARPVSTSSNTTIDLPPGCGIQTLVADLAGTDPVRVPYDTSVVIDYGNLTRDGLGNALNRPNLDGLVLSFFAGTTLAELETHILDLDTLTTKSFELDLSGGRTASLYQATSRESGAPFDGFRGVERGFWLLRLLCSTCTNNVPPVVVVLEPS